MKNQQQHSWQEISSHVRRLYNHPVSYFTLLGLSYLILLAMSYGLGYVRGLSLGARHLSLFVHGSLATRCAHTVPPELVRRTIINRAYNGTSPYEGFIQPSIVKSSLLQKRIDKRGAYGKIYERLIQKVQPKTIIKFNGFLGGSATYIANLTSQLGLKTQILCLDFHRCPGFHDLFTQNVISENATESILPVPISTTSGSAKLCEWGIKGDLIEIDFGWDSHSAWSNINRVHKLLRPGGVIFGHNNGVGPAVKLFARVNKLRFRVYGEHWMIDSA